jgi:hypothetical protein
MVKKKHRGQWTKCTGIDQYTHELNRNKFAKADGVNPRTAYSNVAGHFSPSPRSVNTHHGVPSQLDDQASQPVWGDFGLRWWPPMMAPSRSSYWRCSGPPAAFWTTSRYHWGGPDRQRGRRSRPAHPSCHLQQVEPVFPVLAQRYQYPTQHG